MGLIFAFGTVPKDSGTFTFFRNIRPVLKDRGIDMLAVSVGKPQADLWDEGYADDGCRMLAPSTFDIKKQAQVFTDWCAAEGVDVVMGVNSEAILSALPHLPERIRVLARCANGYDHGYRITMSGSERLAAIIALSPRLRDDLIAGYGARPEQVTLIPNGIDPAPFTGAVARPRGVGARLELGFLGRLEHNQKGVFHLPRIVRELNRSGLDFRLRIAGKGIHRRTLEKAMEVEIASGQVELIGPISRDEVPGFLAGIDVFLFTSHFEGFPNALLEAMMAGCVPVAWRIDGITDFMLEDGRTGYLFDRADYAAMAGCIIDLSRDPGTIGRISRNVSSEARSRFSSRSTGDAYADAIHRVMAAEPPAWQPVPWEKFRGDPNFDHGWKERLSRLPGLDRIVRLYRERAREVHDG